MSAQCFKFSRDHERPQLAMAARDFQMLADNHHHHHHHHHFPQYKDLSFLKPFPIPRPFHNHANFSPPRLPTSWKKCKFSWSEQQRRPADVTQHRQRSDGQIFRAIKNMAATELCFPLCVIIMYVCQWYWGLQVSLTRWPGKCGRSHTSATHASTKKSQH